MSEKEKRALETIMTVVPNLSEFQKGRLYGYAEAMEEGNKKEGEKVEEDCSSMD